MISVLLNTADGEMVQDISAVYLQLSSNSETHMMFSKEVKFMVSDQHSWSVISCQVY